MPAPQAHIHGRQHSVGGSSTASETVDPSPGTTPAILDQSNSQAAEPENLHAHFNETVSIGSASSEVKPGNMDIIEKEQLVELRTAILQKLFDRIEEVEKLGGEHCIPYFQVQIFDVGVNIGLLKRPF